MSGPVFSRLPPAAPLRWGWQVLSFRFDDFFLAASVVVVYELLNHNVLLANDRERSLSIDKIPEGIQAKCLSGSFSKDLLFAKVRCHTFALDAKHPFFPSTVAGFLGLGAISSRYTSVKRPRSHLTLLFPALTSTAVGWPKIPGIGLLGVS